MTDGGPRVDRWGTKSWQMRHQWLTDGDQELTDGDQGLTDGGPRVDRWDMNG